MFHIDWDAVRRLLPIYAYEYEKFDADGEYVSSTYWHPYEHKGEQPPDGWTNIDREESCPDLWRAAVDEWVKTIVRPNEKAVWYDTATGDFSNTFRMRDLLNSTLTAIDQSLTGGDLAEKTSSWRLIVYRCEYDSGFEFTNMMRIVTKPKEAQ